MEPINVGFIGCGRHATKMLYPTLHRAGMNLVALCDLDEGLARRNARWFGAERIYTDYRAMLDAESLDAVLICTSPASHAALTTDCIERGLPVYVEKPPAMNLAEAETLRDKSVSLGVPVMVGTMKRHALIYQQVKQRITQPDFGAVSAVQVRFGIGWKNGNGFALLNDAGVHMFDLLLALLGEFEVTHVEKHEEPKTHISYALMLKFASGVVGTLLISDQYDWLNPNERLEITGSGGYLVAENLVRLMHYRANGDVTAWEPGFSIPNDNNHSTFIVGYGGALQAFRAAVADGAEVHPSITNACRAMQLIKSIEPDEVYEKGPQDFPHWRVENRWLKK